MLLTWDADQGPDSQTKDHRKRSPFCEFQAKYLSGTWNFRIIDRNIKAIFREYFSSLHEDSGKIFKIMTFTRGPRTTYCTVFVFQEWGDTINQDLLKNKSYLKRDTIGQRTGMSLKNYEKLWKIIKCEGFSLSFYLTGSETNMWSPVLLMSLKLKLKNYRSYQDFTFTMH